MQLIGGKRIRTTVYHPTSNGFVERWHRSLKMAIKCHENRRWIDILLTVLLGLRTCYKDLKASAEYGTTLRIPGEFFTHEEPSDDPNIFLEDFHIHMRELNQQHIMVKKRHFVLRSYISAHTFSCEERVPEKKL